MTARLLQLHAHENMDLLRKWDRAGLLPIDTDIAALSAQLQPNCVLITLHPFNSEEAVALFVDKPHEGGRAIIGLKMSAFSKDKINVTTFRDYAEERNYIDARLHLKPSFSYVRGNVHHRVLMSELPPLGVVPVNVELNHASKWERKLETLKRHPQLTHLRIQLVGFSQAETKRVCRELGFVRSSTVFVL
ncbi:hypothetical protein pEaSNUABM29_00254 [Erwinia phage pEa_SNUABM_29]|nr:hypothetical protein pEaSNUABM29_00254 [Erwinia phage pEa_SNUABM_29]